MLSSPLVKGISAEEIERIWASARRRTFSKGEVVFHEGDPGDALHVITKGRFAARVTTEYGDVVTLVVLDEGDIFGEMALLDEDAIRGATVVALEVGETMSLHRSGFQELKRAHPEVTDVLLSVLTQKVRRYTQQLVEALYVPAETRIIRRLLELADLYAPDEAEATVPLSQEHLGGLAGASRVTVNRVLRKEEQKGNVRLGRGRTTILNRPALEERAR